MQSIAHGVDLVSCDRVGQLWRRHGQHFLDRVFTRDEQAYALRHADPVQRLAARFAAKEAVWKLLGTGWSEGTAWTDIEVVNAPNGRPSLRLSGRTAELARTGGLHAFQISLTHTRELAMASVVALADAPEHP